MVPTSHIPDIAHVIQISVAPVFLLTGVAATISALTARIGRVIDRARALEAELPGHSGRRATEAQRELGRLARRARLVNIALTLCTLTALLVTILIGLAFVGAYLNLELSVAVGVMFLLAMVVYSAGLLAFLTEVWLATRQLRIGFLHEQPEGEWGDGKQNLVLRGRAYTGAQLQESTMSKVENLEKQIRELSPEELAEFRRWYAEFDAELWDRQFESDVKAGKLDAIGERALRAHQAGQTTKL